MQPFSEGSGLVDRSPYKSESDNGKSESDNGKSKSDNDNDRGSRRLPSCRGVCIVTGGLTGLGASVREVDPTWRLNTYDFGQ